MYLHWRFSKIYVSDTSQTKSNYILGKIIFKIMHQIALISGRLCIIYFLCFYGLKNESIAMLNCKKRQN